MAKNYTHEEIKDLLKSFYDIDGLTNAKIRKLFRMLKNIYHDNKTCNIPTIHEYTEKFYDVAMRLDGNGRLKSLQINGNYAYANMYLRKDGLMYEVEMGVPQVYKLIDLSN